MTVWVESTYRSGVETATSLLVGKAPSGRYQRRLWAVARASDFRRRFWKLALVAGKEARTVDAAPHPEVPIPNDDVGQYLISGPGVRIPLDTAPRYAEHWGEGSEWRMAPHHGRSPTRRRGSSFAGVGPGPARSSVDAASVSLERLEVDARLTRAARARERGRLPRRPLTALMCGATRSKTLKPLASSPFLGQFVTAASTACGTHCAAFQHYVE
jgi:hypothetical protein